MLSDPSSSSQDANQRGTSVLPNLVSTRRPYVSRHVTGRAQTTLPRSDPGEADPMPLSTNGRSEQNAKMVRSGQHLSRLERPSVERVSKGLSPGEAYTDVRKK